MPDGRRPRTAARQPVPRRVRRSRRGGRPAARAFARGGRQRLGLVHADRRQEPFRRPRVARYRVRSAVLDPAPRWRPIRLAVRAAGASIHHQAQGTLAAPAPVALLLSDLGTRPAPPPRRDRVAPHRASRAVSGPGPLAACHRVLRPVRPRGARVALAAALRASADRPVRHGPGGGWRRCAARCGAGSHSS